MIYFARMLDKIRLNAAGNLREDFCGNLGSGFDARCVNFLRVNYPALKDCSLQVSDAFLNTRHHPLHLKKLGKHVKILSGDGINVQGY